MAKRLKRIRKRGGKVVIIDPRQTETAKLADDHHFIRPGTDAVFLLAWLNVLVEEIGIQPESGNNTPTVLTLFAWPRASAQKKQRPCVVSRRIRSDHCHRSHQGKLIAVWPHRCMHPALWWTRSLAHQCHQYLVRSPRCPRRCHVHEARGRLPATGPSGHYDIWRPRTRTSRVWR